MWDLFRSSESGLKKQMQQDPKAAPNEKGRLIKTLVAESISKVKYEFKEVKDEVNAVVWLPNSATDLIAATENNLVICDTRQPWVVKQKIVDTGNTRIVSSIKFDPFD